MINNQGMKLGWRCLLLLKRYLYISVDNSCNKIIQSFFTMGCNASDAGNPNGGAFTGKSPARECLNEENKRRFRKIIQKDDIKDFIVTVAELALPLNAEISEPGLKWMMTHLACRYDSNKCLEYMLRNYFLEFASVYINYSNAPTIEGYTALHMCAMWKSDKCFNTLMYYGGLSLNSLDKNSKIPLEYAVQNKAKKIVEALSFYKDKGIHFTLLETQKFLSGDIIYDDPSKYQDKELIIDKKKQQKVEVVQTEEQKRLKQEKQRLEQQADKILKQKIKKEAQLQAEKAEAAKNAQKNKLKEEQKIKIEKQAREKFEQNLKLEREKYKKEMELKEQQLKKIKDQLRKAEEDRIENEKQKAQREAEQFAKQQQDKLKEKIKDKNDALDRLKEKERNQQDNPEQNEQENKPQQQEINVQECLNALRASFEAIQQELPPELEANYKKALEQGIFYDEQFPAEISSIGNENNQGFDQYKDSIVWLRPEDIFGEGQQYQVFQGIDPNDIQQGQLGVCYMLATISSLASNPQNIQRMFIYSDTNVGFYVIKLYINGVTKFFQLDDQIPCNINTNFPMFSQPVGNQIWVMLMEKCWAKAIGSFKSAESMVPHQMMGDLSGSPAFGRDFQDQNGKYSTQQNLELIHKYCNAGNTIVLASKEQPPEGIAESHAYTLLKSFKNGSNYIFKIRNPWGQFESQGDYSQGSSLLTPAIKKQIGWTDEQDGIFFLSESELIQAYLYYSVCFNLKDHYYSYLQFTSQTDQDKYFKFTLKKKSQTNVKLTQPFNRMINDQNYEYSPMAFQIAKLQKNKKVKFLDEGTWETVTGEKEVHGFEDICKDLDAGDYFVRVRMNWVNQQAYNSAVISVYSGEEVEIQELDPAVGVEYLKLMYLDLSQKSQKFNSDGGSFKLVKLKSQMAFITEIDKPGQFIAELSFPSAIGTVAAICRADDNSLRIPTSKGKPGIGTFDIIDRQQSSLEGGNLRFFPA